MRDERQHFQVDDDIADDGVAWHGAIAHESMIYIIEPSPHINKYWS